MKRGGLALGLWACAMAANAFTWQDLWQTGDQQGASLLRAGQFKKAVRQFDRQDWRAVAAFRAGDYQQAADLFETQGDESGFYNQGNALAHLGLYEKALQAYDKTLAINPNHADARFNRKVIEDLLKKEKDKQEQQNKQESEQQSQGKSGNQPQQDRQNKPQSSQDKQNPKAAPSESKDAASKHHDEDKKAKDKATESAESKARDKQEDKKQDKPQAKAGQDPQSSALSNEAQEAKQANQQWLRLIPDDPGGLLREKFLRDHLKRQRGW